MNTAPIWIALIGAMSAIAVAWLETRKTKKAVGKPNGAGNVVQMLERVLTNQGRHDERLRSIEGRLSDLENDEGYPYQVR